MNDAHAISFNSGMIETLREVFQGKLTGARQQGRQMESINDRLTDEELVTFIKDVNQALGQMARERGMLPLIKPLHEASKAGKKVLGARRSQRGDLWHTVTKKSEKGL